MLLMLRERIPLSAPYDAAIPAPYAETDQVCCVATFSTRPESVDVEAVCLAAKGRVYLRENRVEGGLQVEVRARQGKRGSGLGHGFLYSRLASRRQGVIESQQRETRGPR